LSDNHYAIILCGGSGTRLWPISSTNRPKQLLKFESKLSLLQETILRTTKKVDTNNIYLIANHTHKFIIQDQLLEMGLDRDVKLILEPESKNTLPAITLACSVISSRNIDAIISVFPSDHKISDENQFLNIWSDAFDTAFKDYFTLIGITPTFPSEAYGYIEPQKKQIFLNSKNISLPVKKFTEKPKFKLANQYVNDGFLWNAGMFIFKFKVFSRLLKEYQKDLFLKFIQHDPTIDLPSVYSTLKSESIDNGLLEYAKNIAVVPGKFGWSDLGNWDSIYNFIQKNNDKNVLLGDVVSLNSKNNIILNEQGIVALSDVDGLVVINTPDATLVCKREDSERVKELVKEIQIEKKIIQETHVKVHRPWGSYTVIEQGEGYKIKRIEVNPNQKLSLQLHKKRSEHWVVIEGIAKVTNGENIFNIEKDQSTYIPINTKHRLENTTDSILKIIEVQSGNYLEEDDIERFEDNYGRLE